MDSLLEVNFPKEEPNLLPIEWLLDEQIQRSSSLEGPFLPTSFLLDNPYNSPVFPKPNHEQYFDQSLGNIGGDLYAWDVCPPLCEEAWEPISILPPSIPMPEISINHHASSYGNEDNKFLLPYTNNFDEFNDQTLGMVVYESLRSKRSENGVDGREGSKKSKISKHESLQYQEIRKYFDLPISKAAKELNVGLTVLKKRCRELNIKRWPHRKIKSLKALINNVKEMGMLEVAEVLDEHRKKLHLLPELELTAEAKKLRQACFKANYKKRRALALLTH